MKICYLANSASVHTQRWAKHFAGRQHDVTVISFDAAAIEGIRVLHLISFRPLSQLNIMLNLFKVRRLLKKINPDVLHAHYVTSYGLAAALAGKHPLIITAWGSDVLVTPEKSWILRQIVRYALGRADLITSMADHMTRLLIKRRYATDKKIITLPFGVDTEIFNLGHRTRQHGDGASLIVSTRRLDVGLDVDVFIKAVPKVLISYPDSHFIVASDGPLRISLEKLAINLGIANRITFLGDISHKEMPGLLGRADVFVSTSRSDGNNVSLNEAMACGAFPIATDIPANQAWIESGKNGLLFPCRDSDALALSIVEAIRQPHWRQAVMTQNWEIIQSKASWSNEMTKMENVYNALVS